MTNAATIKAAREAAGLSAREAAALVGVTTLTWQRWEGQSSRDTEIPYAHWNLFLLLTGKHPVFRLVPVDGAPGGRADCQKLRFCHRLTSSLCLMLRASECSDQAT